MSKESFDEQLNEVREGENWDSAGVCIGSIAIIKWLRNQKEPEARDWYYKWFRIFHNTLEEYKIDRESFKKYQSIALGLANEAPYRHPLIKKFYSFEDAENLGMLLVNLQAFAEIERQYAEPAYEEHQARLDSIFEDEFDESSEKIDDIKKLAKALVDNAREQGMDDVIAPPIAS